LHLLKELIDVHQIILGSQIGHWRQSIMVLWHGTAMTSVAINRDQLGSSWEVVGKSTSVNWDAL
jgi:hypothetical protein